VEQGILWAEEKSRNSIKSRAKKLTGSEKLEQAGSFVLDMIRAQGWPERGAAAIKARIEAKLGYQRANGGKPRLDAENSPDLPEPSA